MHWTLLFFLSLGCLFPLKAEGAEVNYPGMTAKEFKVAVLGTIVSQKGANVILLKYRATNEVKAHREGSQIFEKYTLVKVESASMLLSYMEFGRQLYLQVYKDGFVGAKKAESKAAVANEGFQDSYREDGFERDKNAITMTDAYREKLIKTDLPVILMQASAEPVITNGQIVGFRLDQLEPNSIFIKAGLKNGDVVTSINDVALDDVTATIKLLNSLKSTNEITFEMQRNNQKIPVNLKVQ